MAVTRFEKPCLSCGCPVYQIDNQPPKCSHCGQIVPPEAPETARGGGWSRVAWQMAAVFAATAVVLVLAAVGLMLPPRVMLAAGVGAGLSGAAWGVWSMAGAIYDERRGR